MQNERVCVCAIYELDKSPSGKQWGGGTGCECLCTVPVVHRAHLQLARRSVAAAVAWTRAKGRGGGMDSREGTRRRRDARRPVFKRSARARRRMAARRSGALART